MKAIRLTKDAYSRNCQKTESCIQMSRTILIQLIIGSVKEIRIIFNNTTDFRLLSIFRLKESLSHCIEKNVPLMTLSLSQKTLKINNHTSYSMFKKKLKFLRNSETVCVSVGEKTCSTLAENDVFGLNFILWEKVYRFKCLQIYLKLCT